MKYPQQLKKLWLGPPVRPSSCDHFNDSISTETWCLQTLCSCRKQLPCRREKKNSHESENCYSLDFLSRIFQFSKGISQLSCSPLFVGTASTWLLLSCVGTWICWYLCTRISLNIYLRISIFCVRWIAQLGEENSSIERIEKEEKMKSCPSLRQLDAIDGRRQRWWSRHK